MLAISSALQSKFEEQLQLRAIPGILHGTYQKWLRYYLDFCQKYRCPPRQEKSLLPFLKKLQDKRQSRIQQNQAVKAIRLYYDILTETGKLGASPQPTPNGPSVHPLPLKSDRISIAEPRPETVFPFPVNRSASRSKIQNVSESATLPKIASPEPLVPADFPSFPEVPETGASWRSEYIRLAEEIQVRHYSPKTLKTYRGWVAQFQTFTKSKVPAAGL